MIQTIPCPDAARLRALIAETDVPDYDELESHLAHCPRCQERLDEIAVGESGWLRDAGLLATTPVNDPEMTKTLHRLRDEWPDDGPPISLDFLKPTDQPGLLGTLGRYQVLEVIGRGAFGIVLKAIDPDLLRPVAIKVLAPYLASSGTARARFLREARAVAAVSHDHIVTIHAVEAAELPYLVMEFVSGISLQARLDRDGPLPPRDIARIGLQAANGLAAAHAVGLVHRDIKPSNILLENGVERVKITDFGLARAADDARLTQSGTAAGTPLYMSPEQTRGETVDQRSDLFSLGSVLYTMATGFPPFRAGSTMGVLNRIANDPPRPIRETVPDFPAALEAIIMQLLEKDPSGRFQIGADVSVRLSGFLADPRAEVIRPRRRQRKWWETSLPILAGIIVVGVVLIFQTKNGTILVETEDPDVQVTVDGEVLKISGTGVTTIRVKPGEYIVQASKAGKRADVSHNQGQGSVRVEPFEKRVVWVRVKPDAPKAADVTDADMKRMETELGQLLQQRVLAGKLKPGEMDPLDARFSALMLEATNRDTPPEKAKAALLAAYEVSRQFGGQPVGAPANPDWNAKLKLLNDGYQSFLGRLMSTPARDLMILATPIDPDKVGGGELKRVAIFRNQFESTYSRALKLAAELTVVMKNPAATSTTTTTLRELETEIATLKKLLDDMEPTAIDLGAKPAPPKPIDNPWDGKLKKLTGDYQTLFDRLTNTGPGRVLLATPPGTAPDKVVGKDEDIFNARRLLVLRDQFALLVPQFQKEIGRWEAAALAARDARVRFEAGTIPSVDAEKADLVVKDAERALTAAEQSTAKIVTDLKKLADEIDPPPADVQTEFKKVMAEYDALVLRLANNSVGRILALLPPDESWDSRRVQDLVGGDSGKAAKAIQLIELRTRVRAQMARAQTALNERESAVRRKAEAERGLKDHETVAFHAAAIENAEYEIKLRTTAIRGQVDDLKKMAEELDPTPVPVDAELKKVMGEYDALTLRLVNTPIGRILALVPPDRQWNEGEMTAVAGGDPAKRGQAIRLLDQRRHILDQADLAQKAINARAVAIKQQANDPGRFLEKDARAANEEVIQKNEHDAKVRITALRGLIGDLKKITDELDPPKGK
jgi:serine/threonine protein kinase